MKKNILITHAFGPDNRGDHELLLKLMGILREKYGDDVSIIVFTSFPEKSSLIFKEDKVSFVKSPVSLAGLEKNIANYINIAVLLFTYLLYYLFNIKFFLNKDQKEKMNIIRKVDVIFYTPGGYLYSNGRSFYANIVNGLLLKKSNAPIYLSPMSVGPFYNNFDLFLCRKLLMSVTEIFLRESYSYELVKGMGFNNIHLATDLAWYIQVNAECVSSDKWVGRYVITVIDWDYKDVGNVIYFKERYCREIISCCMYLANESQTKVILYNQVGSGKGNSKDEQLIRYILKEIPDFVEFEEEELTPSELKARLKNSLGLVASRFHSALFAIQVDTPFIALAYQPKTEFILEDLSLSAYYRKITSFNGKEVAESLSVLCRIKERFIIDVYNAREKARKQIIDCFVNVLN